jgi:hypothetical protein
MNLLYQKNHYFRYFPMSQMNHPSRMFQKFHYFLKFQKFHLYH